MAVTQEQINKAKELNQQYKAWEISADEARGQMADSLYARDPAKLQNADVNVSKYWDDHTEQNYNNSEMWWWENQKYTGENTKNSYTAYDPNATTEWLNPNYQYWRNAQMANSEQANYIANRNDQIASALYNEWKTSIEDVANFLRTQRGFDNSTENERQNTIYSVWKRLGQIAQENWNKDTESSNWPTDQNNDQALQNMQDDLMKDTSGKLYGKVTADETEYGNAINTVADPYNVDRMMAESRIANVKKLQTMDSQSIAASIISWTTPYGEQAMRDLMQYNPQKYEEIQQSIKQLKWQQTINSITSGEWDVSSVINTTDSDIAEFADNNSNSMTSAWQILKDVKSTLESNMNASSAQEQMSMIEWDMARLQNRLKNLDKEASKVFKWDVPQYIVNAYISNRTAEINDELSILENRYNAAYNRYKTELANTQWQAEYQLKLQQLQIQQEQSAVNNWATQQWIMIDWAKVNGTSTNLTQEQITQTFNNFVETYTEWSNGGQCGVFVKKYLSQLWINLPNISSLDSKKALIDSSITEPTEWDIVIMSSPTHPDNWHMAIVSSIDDDWTIHLLESNWNDDQKVHTTRTLKPWDSRIFGYYRPQAANYNPVDNFIRKDWTTIETKDTRFNQLTADEQKVVEWLINKQINPATLTTRYGEQRWSLLKSIASEIDPNYTDGAYSTAVKTRNDWSTSSSKWSNSRNWTAVATAMELYNMADVIWNTRFKDRNGLVNFFKWKVSDEKYVEMIANLNTLAFEYAWALKWWASPTEQDVNDAKEYITANLWKKATKTTAKTLARMLYNKNVNEAQNYFTYTYEKAPSIWDNNVEQWMINTVWLPLSDNYALKSMTNTLPDYDGWNSGWNTYQSYLNN